MSVTKQHNSSGLKKMAPLALLVLPIWGWAQDDDTTATTDIVNTVAPEPTPPPLPDAIQSSDSASFDLNAIMAHETDSAWIAFMREQSAANINVTLPDSVEIDSNLIYKPVVHEVYLQYRGYKDCIALRWAPDSYVAMREGMSHGYNLLRMAEGQTVPDTLLRAVRPLTEDGFIARFGETDTLAMAAAELLWGTQPSFDGSLSWLQIKEEQEGIYSFAMLMCDMRPDVAEAMGLMYSDSTAVRGRKYSYAISPCRNDTAFPFMPVGVLDAYLGEYKQEAYPVAPKDSVYAPSNVRLSWPRSWYTTYDIERRQQGEHYWTKLNKRPYMTGSEIRDTDGELINIYNDHGLEPGTYEYRIYGHDLFGQRTLPGPVLTVEVPDMMPPAGPRIRKFVVLPGDTAVDIHISKDSLEDDLRGYRVYYSNRDLLGDNWVPFNLPLFYSTDTILHVKILGMPSGHIAVAAVDQAGNEGFSTPMPFHREDKTPPQVPKNLRGAVSVTGIVVLSWSPSPDLDLHYYDVHYANDTTHNFQQMPRPMTPDTIAFDTLDLSVMQQYRYYRVTAIDWAGNVSFPTPWVTIVRPNFKAPQACQLDSTWQDGEGVYSRWVPSPEPDILEFRVLRRLRGDEEWTVINVLTTDSIQDDGFLYVSDTPEPNPERRYHYCIQTVNTTGVTSDLSLYAQYLYRGPTVLPVTVHLQAAVTDDRRNFTGDESIPKHITLAWEVDGLKEEYKYGGFFIIYYRLEGEEEFRELTTQPLNRSSYEHVRFPNETQIEYCMQYRNEDLRYGPMSRTVSVKSPAKPQPANQ